MKKAVIIIPTYNEAYDIEKIVESVFSITSKINNWQFTVLVIDSTSPDGTSQIVEGLKKKHKNLVLIKTKKEGLGKAYMTGFTYALEKLEADLLFEMDADFSHDPSVLPEFVRKIDEGADFVIGSRYRKGGSIPADWGMNRKIYSVLGNLIIRLGFMKLKISDWTSGYRAIRSWVIKSSLSYIQNSTGYVFQVALLEKAVKLHARVEEIPINFVDRKYGVSKLNSGQYIKNTLLYVLTHSSFIKYVLVGGSGFIIDFGLSYLMIERVHTQFPVWLATIMSAEVAIIW
ncbi:MAG TPA: glycosyltransferase, partial [Acinetobacter johnsonii]|nr:glycosyltransferase [Acinetobacter johnsonii]